MRLILLALLFALPALSQTSRTYNVPGLGFVTDTDSRTYNTAGSGGIFLRSTAITSGAVVTRTYNIAEVGFYSETGTRQVGAALAHFVNETPASTPPPAPAGLPPAILNNPIPVM